jgi:hypothetical protein
MACCGKAKNIVHGFSTLVVDKIKRADKYEFTDSRVRECQVCKDNNWIGKRLMCKHCGCFIPAKARVPDEKCPLGKW